MKLKSSSFKFVYLLFIFCSTDTDIDIETIYDIKVNGQKNEKKEEKKLQNWSLSPYLHK